MKIKRWFIFLIAACLLATTVSAHGDNIETDGCAVSLPMTRSIDTTFDLDFGQASNWYINFDNEAGLFKFNHKYVDVFYDGFANADSSTIITLPDGMMEAEAAADPDDNMEDSDHEE